MDYLEANLDWLEERLAPLLKGNGCKGPASRVHGLGFRVKGFDQL